MKTKNDKDQVRRDLVTLCKLILEYAGYREFTTYDLNTRVRPDLWTKRYLGGLMKTAVAWRLVEKTGKRVSRPDTGGRELQVWVATPKADKYIRCMEGD